MRAPSDPDPARAWRALDRVTRMLARPYRAAKQLAVTLRGLAGAVATAVAPGSAFSYPGPVLGATLSRLVLLKERHEAVLRQSRGGAGLEWMAIEARVKALEATPVDRIVLCEIDALMTDIDEWTRRRPR